MTSIQERIPETKMTEIERARSRSPRVISKFETLIRSGDDLALYRINPMAFARDRAVSEAESIDLFLHATRSGLFEMSWEVACPQSGMVLDSQSLAGRLVRGGGGMPQRSASGLLAFGARVANDLGRVIGKHARHWREVADVAVHHAKQRPNGFSCDAVEIAHLSKSPRYSFRR